MRPRSTILAALAAAVAISAVPIAQASPDDREHRSRSDDGLAAARHFEGRITSVNRERHSFRLRRERGVRVGFRVNNRTRFERIAGFPGLRHGLAVEVSAGPTDAVGSHARSSAATPTRATTTAAATATTATTDPRPGAGAARHPPAPA